MARCALIVELFLKPDAWPKFADLMHEHARRTRAEEPGCRQFDVVQPHTEDGAVDEGRAVLIEVYDDLAAYEAHRANPRMPEVNAALDQLITARRRIIGSLP